MGAGAAWGAPRIPCRVDRERTCTAGTGRGERGTGPTARAQPPQPGFSRNFAKSPFRFASSLQFVLEKHPAGERDPEGTPPMHGQPSWGERGERGFPASAPPQAAGTRAPHGCACVGRRGRGTHTIMDGQRATRVPGETRCPCAGWGAAGWALLHVGQVALGRAHGWWHLAALHLVLGRWAPPHSLPFLLPKRGDSRRARDRPHDPAACHLGTGYVVAQKPAKKSNPLAKGRILPPPAY